MILAFTFPANAILVVPSLLYSFHFSTIYALMKTPPLKFRSLSSLIVAFALLSMVACKKDSDDPAPNGKDGVEGSWQITALKVSPAQNGIVDYIPLINALLGNDCFTKLTFNFKANGTIEGSAPAGCQGAEDTASDQVGINDTTTWKIEGNKLILTSGTDRTEYDLDVNKNTMSLSEKEVEDGVTYTYTLEFKRV